MKRKILLLSDDMRHQSGVGIMSREIVFGTVHKYDWVQLGAGINHPEVGSLIDLSVETKGVTGVDDANVKIYPYNGYGDIIILRRLIEVEKPDAILHFTDPHYWGWLYDNEHEIRQIIPILFYHVWDNVELPKYNRNFYESCDWIGCISKLTYGIVNNVGPLEDWRVSYVPHGINENTFKPIDKISDTIYNTINTPKKREFVLFYNNRNIRRKQPADVIYSYKLFCDQLPKEESSKCVLIMHTIPVDDNGTDLFSVKEDLCSEYDVIFSNAKIPEGVMNELYNLSDCTINISNNEGFGLSTAESLMAGTPIIVNVTGGLQDQCGLNIDGEEFTPKDYIKFETLSDKKKWGMISHGDWCVPVWSVTRNLNGSPVTPYIFEDRINHDDVSDAIMKVYNWGREERKRRGLIGREWMIKNLSSKVMSEKMIEGIESTFKNFTPRKKYELLQVI